MIISTLSSFHYFGSEKEIFDVFFWNGSQAMPLRYRGREWNIILVVKNYSNIQRSGLSSVALKTTFFTTLVTLAIRELDWWWWQSRTTISDSELSIFIFFRKIMLTKIQYLVQNSASLNKVSTTEYNWTPPTQNILACF